MKTELKAEVTAPQEVSQKSGSTPLSAEKPPRASVAMNGNQQQDKQPSELDTPQPQRDAPQSAEQRRFEGQPTEQAEGAADGEQKELGDAAKITAAQDQILSSSMKKEAGSQASSVKAEDAIANGKLEEPAHQKGNISTSFMDLLTGKGEPDKQPAQNPGANPASLFKPVTGALPQGSSPLHSALSSSQPVSQPTNAITMAYQKIAGGSLSAQTFGQVNVLVFPFYAAVSILTDQLQN